MKPASDDGILQFIHYPQEDLTGILKEPQIVMLFSHDIFLQTLLILVNVDLSLSEQSIT